MSNYRMAANGHLHLASAPCSDDLCAPVVVISPEDREQVERLFSLWKGHPLDGLQAALREFANPTPPKPPEPTGLGAVVEDASGERWVRYDRGDLPWLHAAGKAFAQKWRHLDAVRILSEGVVQS